MKSDDCVRGEVDMGSNTVHDDVITNMNAGYTLEGGGGGGGGGNTDPSGTPPNPGSN